jgi:hypothetical protein
MLYFGIFASQPHQYLTKDILSSMTLRIIHHDTQLGVAAYTLFDHIIPRSVGKDDNHNKIVAPQTTTALIMVQLVRFPNMEDQTNDIWYIQQPVVPSTITMASTTVEYGPLSDSTICTPLATYNIGRDFGTIIPEIKQLVYDSKIIPNMMLNPNELRFGLIRKGGIIRLKDYILSSSSESPFGISSDMDLSDPRTTMLDFACRWDDSSIDQDNLRRQLLSTETKLPMLQYGMHALLFSGDDHTDLNFHCVEQIDTNRPRSNFSQSVQVGNKMLDHEESIAVSLSQVPDHITCVVFTISLQCEGIGGPPTSHPSLPQFVSQTMSFYIRHPITHQILAKYQPSEESVLYHINSLFVACLYRHKKQSSSSATTSNHGTDKEEDDEWYLHIVDERINTSTSQTTSIARNVVEKLYKTLNNTSHSNDSNGSTEEEVVLEPDVVF